MSDARGLASTRWRRLRSLPRTTWVGLALALAALAGLVYTEAVALWPSNPAPAADDRALRGVACPHLREAFEHDRDGDRAAFVRSVETAARVGERSLDRSEQRFGRPERAALELESVVRARGKDGERARLLEVARATCGELGLWGAAPPA
jgi:hypothetical protein